VNIKHHKTFWKHQFWCYNIKSGTTGHWPLLLLVQYLFCFGFTSKTNQPLKLFFDVTVARGNVEHDSNSFQSAFVHNKRHYFQKFIS